jgi:hypothetical protein
MVDLNVTSRKTRAFERAFAVQLAVEGEHETRFTSIRV